MAAWWEWKNVSDAVDLKTIAYCRNSEPYGATDTCNEILFIEQFHGENDPHQIPERICARVHKDGFIEPKDNTDSPVKDI